jgi:mannan endo-1,4-beta-mannosidase
MAETLRFGDTGQAVVLLQTRLNALPSGMLPLEVNGSFDLPTLQRVLEFQVGAFVNGVVDEYTWAKLPPVAPQLRDTFYVEGRQLCDPTGARVILRGINLQLLDDWDFPPGDKFDEFVQTGANAVRIMWRIKYPGRPAYGPANLDAFLTKCKANHVIPILGLWDATCSGDLDALANEIVPWWISDDVIAVLNKHKQYLIINPANELGEYEWAGGDQQAKAAALDRFKEAYKAALTRLREKLHMPVMIDAPDCGSSIHACLAIGQELIDHDPDHNLLLSVHAYWTALDGMPHIAGAINANLPLVFGEVANKQDDNNGNCVYDLDGLGQNPAQFGFTYQQLLQTLKAQEIGWLAWSWWPDRCDPRNIANYDWNTRQFQGLSQPYGVDIVNNPDYGLKSTAERAPFFDLGAENQPELVHMG